MDCSSSSSCLYRDIRSPSIPQVRRSFQRAKYGGQPPTDAFLFATSDFPFSLELGKPKTNLTPSQKYTLAQESVGSLVGKRVNRNNQRTGERDPWRYYGAGRKWAKKQKSGTDVNTSAGVEIWGDEESVSWEVDQLTEQRHDQLALWSDHVAQNVLGDLYVSENDCLNSREASNAAAAVCNDNEGRAYSIGIARCKRNRRKPEGGERQWEFLTMPSDSLESYADDGWEIVSSPSTPG